MKCPEGYSAFVPAPLPPKFTWSRQLVAALSDADRTIGRLAGEGTRLPNPHLLLRPFVAREAVLSSRIEGTQATLGELLAAEAGASVDRSPDDLREVGNYVVALEHGIQRLKTLPLSLRLVGELHAKLMHGVRGEHATPGEFRRSQNWIGAPGSTLATATYIPPPPHVMMQCLGAWESFLHNRQLPPLIHAGLTHAQFEAIHPFLDGNGRVGRLLISLLLIERELLPSPLLYISAYFEASRRVYYDQLHGVTENSKWEEWLIYFLTGIARQAEDALSRAERINHLLINWRHEFSGGSSRVPLLLLDQIARNPYLTVKKAATDIGVAFTTVQRALERLAQHGIVTESTGGRRDRVYCAKQILDILEEPTKMSV